MNIPGGVGGPVSVTIDYTYDPLQRLIAADYSTGEFFHYSYDAVGNRLTQDTLAGTNTYVYDIANRLEEWTASPTPGTTTATCSMTVFAHLHLRPCKPLGLESRWADDSFKFELQRPGRPPATDRERRADRVHPRPGCRADPGTLRRRQRLPLRRGAHRRAAAGWLAVSSGRCAGECEAVIAPSAGVAPCGRMRRSDRSSRERRLQLIDNWVCCKNKGIVTALIHLRARYYSPRTGQFVSANSGPAGAHIPQSLAPFVYVMNNPLIRTDPSGLIAEEEAEDAGRRPRLPPRPPL